MKSDIGSLLSAIAVLCMAIPVQALAGPGQPEKQPATQKTVSDVALTTGGDLLGLVVGENGRPMANKPVHVLHNHKLVAKVETDDHGRYQVRGIRPGIHVVQTVGQERACRFWAADMAPPAAKRELILASQSVVRGQCGLDCGESCCGCGESCGGGSCLFGAKRGTVVGVGLFAAAVAVTLATTLDDDDDNFGAPGTPPASP